MNHRAVIATCVSATVLGELVIFVTWGLWLFPGGGLLPKFIWTVVVCGIGMGSVIASSLLLFVVDRLRGWMAVAATTALSVGVLGLLCNWLCFTLDAHFFHFFGAAENPTLFIVNGIVMAAVGGFAIGWLLFIPKGQRFLGITNSQQEQAGRD